MVEDPRASKQVPTWEEAARTALQWLQSWEPDLWQSLVDRGLCGHFSHRQLQDKAIHSATVIFAFVCHE
eukprot:1266929-Lingulodinium_polyedra.AAC.1